MDQFSTSVPDVVLLSGDLPAPAKILYAVMLQQSKGSGDKGGRLQCTLTQRQLSALTHFSKETVFKAMQLLYHAGLVTPLGKSQYQVKNEAVAAWVTLLDQVIKRLTAATYLGEQLMRELLSLIINSERFIDGSRPEWLMNPLSGENLEYDRFYLDGVAFEYNGPQHYHPTTQYPSSEDARLRRARDLIKRGLSAEHGIVLVTVHRDDLSVKGMLAKVGDRLPLRPGVETNPVAKYLEQECKAYRNSQAEKSRREREAKRKEQEGQKQR